MLIKLVSIEEHYSNFNSAQAHRGFSLSEIYLNPSFIVSMKEDLKYLELLVGKKLPEGFTKEQKFTTISLNKGNMGQDLTVVGDVAFLTEKINGAKNVS